MTSLVLGVLSALLLLAAYPLLNVTWLAWVALVPLIHALVSVARLRRAWWLGYLHGFIFYLGLLHWLTHVTVAGYVLLAAYLACYHAAFAVGVAWLLRRTDGPLGHPLARLAWIPSWWVILEWIRNHALSGFGWGLLAYTQASHPSLIQPADLAGAYGVSWLIVLVNVTVGQLLRPQSLTRKVQAALVTGVVMLGVIGYGVWHLRAPATGETLRVAVVQGNIPQEEKWDRAFQESILQRYEALTREAATTSPDLIIWPETSFPGIYPVEAWVVDRTRALAQAMHAPMLVGAPTTTPQLLDPSLWNSALLFGPTGERLARYDKLHLVPFGEFIPFERQFPALRQLIVTGNFDPGHEATVFSLPQTDSELSTLNPQVRFSVLICFEDVFPELSRRFTALGARLLIVITNDAWFGRTSAPHQHLQASIFRAVECRVPVVRSANTGVSGFIDAHGRLTHLVADAARNPLFIAGFATGLVTPAHAGATTLYRRWGDWWVGACAAMTALIWLWGMIFLRRVRTR